MLLTHFMISATQIFIIFKVAESHLLKTIFSRECRLLLLLIFFFLIKLLYSSFFFNLLVNRTDVFWMSISTSYNKFPRFIKKVKLALLYLFHQMRITHISWKDLYVCVWVFILTWAWFNKPFTDNKEYNHCRQRSRTRAKRKRNKHALRKVSLNIRDFTELDGRGICWVHQLF